MARRRRKRTGAQNPTVKLPGGLGGLSGGGMVQKIQQLQKKMEEEQDALADELIEISVGGGMVVVEMDGTYKLIRINIDPEVVDPDDIETLQDLIVSAVNEASEKIQVMSNERMKGLTGGLDIPGLTK